MADSSAMTSQLIFRRLQTSIKAVALLIVLSAPAPLLAEVYKCVNANGGTTYNDSPCEAHEKTFLLNKSARQVQSLDCRIARNFAFDTVARMRQDDTASEVFNAYGGADAVSESARRLVNLIYTFESDSLASAQKIVDLTMDRCQEGLLGESLDRCDSFPTDFIDRYGSCVKARQNEQRGQIKQNNDDKAAQNAADLLGTNVPTLNAANPAVDTDSDDKNDDSVADPTPNFEVP